MDEVLIIFFITIPVAMLFSGFLIARQFRSLENVSVFFSIFVQHRLLFSLGMGLFIGLIFTAFLLLLSFSFSGQLLGIFLGLFLIATISIYFGISLGWGSSMSESATPAKIDSPSDTVTIENLPTAVRLTIASQKRWGMFTILIMQWIVMSLCILPIMSIAVIALAQNYLPQNMKYLVWLFVSGLLLYLLYIKFLEALEFIYDREVIEVDVTSVRIRKFGSWFKTSKEYSSENIVKISTLMPFGTTNGVLKRSRFVNTNLPMLMIWFKYGIKRRHSFGRAIDLSDAQKFLKIIYDRFPQYRG